MSEQVNPSDQDGRRRWRRVQALLRRIQSGERGASAKGMLRGVGPVLVLAVLLTSFGVLFAAQATHLTRRPIAASRATAMASLSAAGTTTPSAAPAADATHASTPSSKSSATQAPFNSGSSSPSDSQDPSVQPYPTPDAFRVASAVVTADPADNFSHTCNAMVYATFTLTMTVDPNRPGETVTYSWGDLFAQGAANHTATISFAPGETTKSVTFQMGFNAGRGDGSPQQDNVGLTYPDLWQWGGTAPVTHATVAFTCVRQVTNLTLTPSISSWNAPCGQSIPVSMTWTLTATPGPRLVVEMNTPTTYDFSDWIAPGVFDAILPAASDSNDPGTQTSGVFNDTLVNSTPDGTAWMKVSTVSPIVLTAQATVVKACSAPTPTT